MCFSMHRLPEMLLTDNSSSSISQQFKQFLEQSGIQPVTSAPHHPVSNVLAEQTVQSF